MGSHVSVVHGFLSSHTSLVPAQLPAEQLSLTVQALPSSHTPLARLWTQPCWGSQPSTVQLLPSSQGVTEPAPHLLAPHTSPCVQALPSSQGPVSAVWLQPAPSLQPSWVHGLPSSQSGPPVPLHRPAVQVSPAVHGLPSSQLPLAGAWLQPVLAKQPSSVQSLLSSQLTGDPPWQTPLWQRSPRLHASPSLQLVPERPPWMHAPCTQLSAVHTTPSSQLEAAPGKHTPSWQASPTVQASPSSHAPACGV
jgi:hypothetical protein